MPCLWLCWYVNCSAGDPCSEAPTRSTCLDGARIAPASPQEDRKDFTSNQTRHVHNVIIGKHHCLKPNLYLACQVLTSALSPCSIMPQEHPILTPPLSHLPVSLLLQSLNISQLLLSRSQSAMSNDHHGAKNDKHYIFLPSAQTSIDQILCAILRRYLFFSVWCPLQALPDTPPKKKGSSKVQEIGSYGKETCLQCKAPLGRAIAFRNHS